MKIKNLYDIPAFEKFLDSANLNREFKDSSAGIVLERNLTQVDPQIFEKQYPDLAFNLSGVTVDNSGGYAAKIQSLRLVDEGTFRNAGDVSSDKGKISLQGEQSTLTVIEREAESQWSETDIRQADLQNINLVSRYLETHNKIYLREIDEAGLLGLNGNDGVLTSSDFTSTAASGAIGTLTPQAMYDEIAGLITDQRNVVNNTPQYSCNTVIVPNYVINALSATILNTAAGAGSVMNALQANFGVSFIGSFRCDDAGGASSSISVAFSNNAESIKMRIPQPLTVGEIIRTGSFKYLVDSKYRIGGADILETTAGLRLTGL